VAEVELADVRRANGAVIAHFADPYGIPEIHYNLAIPDSIVTQLVALGHNDQYGSVVIVARIADIRRPSFNVAAYRGESEDETDALVVLESSEIFIATGDLLAFRSVPLVRDSTLTP